MNMGFWKKVEIEINYYGIARKELSAKSGVPITTINRAIELDTKPFALDALKISKALGLTLEYLLDYSENGNLSTNEIESNASQIELYKKYHLIIDELEKLPKDKQKSAQEIIRQIAEFGK